MNRTENLSHIQEHNRNDSWPNEYEQTLLDKGLDENNHIEKKIESYQLYQGNCLQKLKEFQDNSIDLVITDPPYFLDGFGHNWDKDKLSEKISKAGIVGGLPVGMKFDPKQGIEFQKFYKSVSDEIVRVLRPGGYFLSFCQPRLIHRMGVAVEDAGFEIRDQYAWRYTKKAQAKAFSQNHFVDKMNISAHEKNRIKKQLGNRKTPQLRPEFESILVAQKPKEGTFVENWLKYKTGLIDTSIDCDGKSPTTVFTVEKPVKDKLNGHLTVKPIPLIEKLIKIFSVEGQTILDPFLGSGTTIIAAKATNRVGIGIELNRDYFLMAENRIKQGV